MTEQLQPVGQVLAHCSSFDQWAGKKAATGKAGAFCTCPGCALLDNSMLRAALGLAGGQLGSEGDISSTVTAQGTDKECKQHVQHSQAKPCAM